MKKNLFFKEENIPAVSQKLIPTEIYNQILEYVPIVCVDLVIVKDNQVFLIKRKNKPCEGIYWVQGGRLNKNELPEDGGIRKTAAELNIPKDKIKIIRYLGTFSTEFNNSEQGSASHTINITFQAEIEDISPSFDSDHSDGKWFSINGNLPGDLIGNYQHHPYILELLKLIQSK